MKNTRQALPELLFALLAAIFIVGCSDGSESSSSALAGSRWMTDEFEGEWGTTHYDGNGNVTAEESGTYTGTYTLVFASTTFTWTGDYAGLFGEESTEETIAEGTWDLTGTSLKLTVTEIYDMTVQEYLDDWLEYLEEENELSEEDETVLAALKKETENASFVYYGTYSGSTITITTTAINGVIISESGSTIFKRM